MSYLLALQLGLHGRCLRSQPSGEATLLGLSSTQQCWHSPGVGQSLADRRSELAHVTGHPTDVESRRCNDCFDAVAEAAHRHLATSLGCHYGERSYLHRLMVDDLYVDSIRDARLGGISLRRQIARRNGRIFDAQCGRPTNRAVVERDRSQTTHTPINSEFV